ncbi:ABC1 kinase family protein [Paenibacillus senegalensis]|uniref:ABC1 kinase family protein n=1 Tax=Paenibacillus senegalensis TaxID=1465766 RepID=UPI000289A749|nr:AarF/ABC1/UbiB kinase family protein [Paenibacillus senegalensis]
MGIGKKIRHLQRYREIAAAFVRYGFGYLVKSLGLPQVLSNPLLRSDVKHNLHEMTIGERLRLFLEDLGPTFVKMGQIASTRPDLVPKDIIDELEKLQDHVSAFPFSEAKGIIERELHKPLDELFANFHEEAFAAASIGQVHYAELKTGEKVVVKVQRPEIQAEINTDLEILVDLARMAESRLEWARNYRVRDMILEFAKALKKELDYMEEAKNIGKFGQQYEKIPDVHIPLVYNDYSSRRVLTMQYLEGIKLSEKDKLKAKGYNCRQVAERYAETILHQVLIEGFFHGDPHPGNVLVMGNGELALLDFGMVGRLTQQTKSRFASLLVSLRNQNTDGVIRAISQLGLVPEDTDMDVLRDDVELLRDKYYKVPFSEISMGEAVNDLFGLAFRHDIRIPSDLTLLGKTLLTMEGVVGSLDPSISIFDMAEPFGRRLFKERLNPKDMVKHIMASLPDYLEVAGELPGKLTEVMSLVKKGKLQLQISIPELELFLIKLDRISNRLSFSIVLLSFSIIMVGLIIGTSVGAQGIFRWTIPVIEIGFVVAALFFIWLIYSIIRSGRF